MRNIVVQNSLKEILAGYSRLLKTTDNIDFTNVKNDPSLNDLCDHLDDIDVLMGKIQSKNHINDSESYLLLIELSNIIRKVFIFPSDKIIPLKEPIKDSDVLRPLDLSIAIDAFYDSVDGCIIYASRYIISDLEEQIKYLKDSANDNNSELDKKQNQIINKIESRYNSHKTDLENLLNNSKSNLDSNLEDAKSYIHSVARDLNKNQQDNLNQNQRSITDLVNKAKTEHEEYINHISSVFEQYEKESSNRIQVRIQKAETIVSSLTEKVAQANKDLSESVQEQKTNLEQFSQNNRSSLIDIINKTSSDNLTKIQEAQSQALSSLTEQINNEISVINEKINSEVKKFEAKRIDMDNLLEKVGLARDAEVTISQADKEEATADQLRSLGFKLLYVSILLLVVFFAEYVGLNFWSDVSKSLSDLTIDAFAIRFMTVILISSPAIYLLKESAYHRNKENLYRQRGTQLLTIRGYLADLPQEQRADVKHKLAENFFSFHNGKTDTKNVPDFLRDMKEAVGIAKSLNGQTKTVSQRFNRKEK
ncbi:hypothetical protein AB6F11_07195 [Vibrio sp. 10N.247.311.14]|uniref:hypothetical protein n=1 Tax=unclassified Vibrio TaxID=2614977 RepID=UPI000CC1D85A|nr:MULTISPECIES: hypothetical protein [unclassified Vibrio]PMK16862.1 hypothetical protein BCU05_02615 [Vibrio sp. 10N.261.54.C3]TKF47402.1 hypothetical protein FCV57_00175 [Vibrio sp. F13]TKF66468.1 hypothetical protein FCV58_10620 [Vibrio sp. F13]